ncbi:hypothetical protein [Aureliella helgolandensis]|uniref:Prenyltransferase and squalene oxidase repeat protein n=1 Tax=Aureliella helgolandensis TaxID=2527968 RepID=A0A518GF03_9BACT|nr:hypothetical protein [Aureliella helgolandensis]QDV27181.1 hypothetical protein Q31a_55690 [Aureliella helgolandensis]
MTDHRRYSDLAGISSADEDAELTSFWPVNLALGFLGAAVIGLGFYLLDQEDPNPLRNPWLYAIAIPVALVACSLLLNNLVSRVVEKSMQLAFLLSMLIHLLLLVYAVNIVIFSRMWPDAFEAFSIQRQQLERQTLLANQYHRVNTKSTAGHKPDYLQHVATEHQPTEIELAESPALQLTRSAQANLVSPAPRVERTANAHLIERLESNNSVAASAEQLASLSRSTMETLPRTPTTAPSPPPLPFESTQLPSLAPSEPSSRSQRQRSDIPNPIARVPASSSVEPVSPPLQSAVLLRAEPDAPSATSQPITALPRTERAPPNTPLARPSIDSPELVVDSNTNNPSIAPSPAATNRNSASRQRNTPLPLAAPTVSTLPARSLSNVQLERQEASTALTSPLPSSGTEAQRIARDTAGGQSGLPSAASQPVYGAETLAAQAKNSPANSVAPAETRPNRVADRRPAASQLPSLDLPQSPRWTGTPSLSTNSTGSAQHRIERNRDDLGAAARDDFAGLQGAGRPIERATVGLPGDAGPTISSEIAEIVAGASPTQPSTSEPPSDELAADAVAGAQLQRKSDSGQTGLSPLNDFGPSHAEADNTAAVDGLESYATQMQRQELAPAAPSAADPSLNVASNGPTRTELDNALAPAQAAIAIPELTGDDRDSTAASLAPLSGSPLESISRDRRWADEPTTAMLLEIDANLGAGGVAPQLDQTGPVLARRSERRDPLALPQIDAQRFARQDVGGPLAAGQQASVPKPAFQQRIERLRDRDPQDPSTAAPETELAIERGLTFLSKFQRPNGSWRLQDFDTTVLIRSDTAATGLALLAFQGAGYTHRQFKYADQVDLALKFLIENQRPSGDLYIPQDPASDQNAWLYSHGIATLALCEAYGMTQDPELKVAAQQALNFMVASQDPKQGGWRYRPQFGADTSVSGWFMMAFKSGQLAGLEVPSETFDRIENYLDASQQSPQVPYLYRYNPYAADTPQQRHGLQPTAVMTSVGLLMRLYFDWNRNQPRMLAGADHLLDHLPNNGTAIRSQRDTYYWYYATQVMFHMQGAHWKRWHDELYPLLINHQVAQGEFEGSWDPLSPTPDLWANYGGRLYVTTLNLLSLEVSYRHLPLYDATAK